MTTGQAVQTTSEDSSARMKFLLSIFVVAAVALCVSAETCTTDSDCVNTQCGAGSSVLCQHPDNVGIVQDGGLCTCSDSTTGECQRKEDCYGTNSALNCPDASRHCYDNKCICDRFPIGK